MKKYIIIFLVLFLCTQITAKKFVRESRTQLQESIACEAVNILKSSHNTLKSCAEHVRTLKHADPDIATIIEQVVDVQKLTIKIAQELIDDEDGCWAKASRQTLKTVCETLQKINQQIASKNSDKIWWCDVCSQINTVIPLSQKHDKDQ